MRLLLSGEAALGPTTAATVFLNKQVRPLLHPIVACILRFNRTANCVWVFFTILWHGLVSRARHALRGQGTTTGTNFTPRGTLRATKYVLVSLAILLDTLA